MTRARTPLIIATYLLGWAIGLLAANCFGIDLQEKINNAGTDTVIAPGTHYVDTTLVINHSNGGGLFGGGMPAVGHKSKSGWRTRADRDKSTRLVFTGPKDQPAIRWKSTQAFCMARMGVEHANGGVGILYPATKGWGASMNKLTHVSFIGCSVGFQAGENEKDPNCADVVFDQCLFERCDTGFRSMNHQGVNYDFRSCNWNQCGTAIDVDRGGNVRVWGGQTYGLRESFLRIGYGGPNTMPCSIVGTRFDRQPKRDNIPLVVDASDAQSTIKVAVDACQMTGAGKSDGHGQPLFVLPAKYRKDNEIRVGQFSTTANVDLTPQRASK